VFEFWCGQCLIEINIRVLVFMWDGSEGKKTKKKGRTCKEEGKRGKHIRR